MNKPTIIGGIDVSRSYTGPEVIEMNASGRLRDVTLEGYCSRVDADGSIRFIPFYESTRFRMEEGQAKTQVSYDFADSMLDDVKSNHPIIRRTPQERVASMFLRLMTAYKQTGTLMGIPPELIKRVAGNAWREGEPLTAEVIRAVAAHYLGVGEVDNKTTGGNHAIKDRTPEVAK